jgi:hypothetical protein
MERSNRGNGELEEQISFTGVVQNANGTATLTGVSTVLFVDPYTETSGLAKTHAGSTEFVISNTAGFYGKLTSKADDETITGLWVFPSGANNPTIGTSTYVAPTSSTQIATKQYVDDVAAGGTTTYDQQIISGLAGENLTAGKIVYLKESDSRWYMADADLTATFNELQLGMAQAIATTGNSVNILTSGIDFNRSGLTPGAKYYLSNTAGAISTTPGTNTVFLGWALTATSFFFNARNIDFPTAGEKDALVGDNTDVAVGSANKFVTQTGLQHGAEKYVLSASASSTAYTATLSPAPTSYTNGMEVLVKIDVANTTSTPTLNVNGLGAKTIVKGTSTPLVANDLIIGQVARFVYDGTNMVLQNPSVVTTFKTGSTTHDMTSTTTTTIAHGLGTIPKLVTFHVGTSLASAAALQAVAYSYGAYDGVTQNSNYVAGSTNGSTIATGQDTSNAIHYAYGGTAGANSDRLVGAVTVDATNITITWTKTGSPTGTGNIIWTAQA